MALNPPYVENKSPAFYGNAIVIPFQLNRAVGINDFQAIAAIVKTVSTGAILINETRITNYVYDNKIGCYKVTIPATSLNVGQYYKVQIAFVDNSGSIGSYSNTTVVKCTAEPIVIIEGLGINPNINRYGYIGSYTNSDTTEKPYSYRFNIYDAKGDIIETSGDYLYIDTPKWTLRRVLEPNVSYYITFTVLTINGLEVASRPYQIIESNTITLGNELELSATVNKDDGYISLDLTKTDIQADISSKFVLLRLKENDNTEIELCRFALNAFNPAKSGHHICNDYTVEQGAKYRYALQAYTDNQLYSNKRYNKEGYIQADFEDMYLYDGKKQLKIKFNPKVSSFKTTILESKVDTLGGKYPFIFRNGNIGYKEFPISGLISVLGDENNEFLSGINNIANLKRDKTASEGDEPAAHGTQLTGDNFYNERQFKLEVLNWLTNGQPKLFRSPAEGNYIINLMGVTLTPTDALGRMLHTFTANACEVAEYNNYNLSTYGFLPKTNVDNTSMIINQIAAGIAPIVRMRTLSRTAGVTKTFSAGVQYMVIEQGVPNGSFTYKLADGTARRENMSITGSFYFPTDILSLNPLIEITFDSDAVTEQTILTYGSYGDTANDWAFGDIIGVHTEQQIKQVPGVSMDAEWEFVNKDQKDNDYSIEYCYKLTVYKKDIVLIYTDDSQSKFWFNEADIGNDALRIKSMDLDPNINYQFEYIDSNGEQKVGYVNGSQKYDTLYPQKMNKTPNYTLILNNETFDYSGKSNFNNIIPNSIQTFKDFELKTLYIGSGLYIDIVYLVNKYERKEG